MSIDLERELGKVKGDSAQVKLAKAGVAWSQAWRELYGALPTIGKVTQPGNSKTAETAAIEKQISSWDLGIGGKNPSELEKLLKDAKIETGSFARSMIRNSEFTTLPEPTTIRLGMLSVADMGFEGVATTAQILGTKEDIDEQGNTAPFTKGRIAELGFELCPPEVAVYQRLHDKNQEMNTAYWIAMKPIADSDGDPDVFGLGRNALGLWLLDDWASPDSRWLPGNRLVVSVPQVTSKP